MFFVSRKKLINKPFFKLLAVRLIPVFRRKPAMVIIISPRTACRYLRDINDAQLQFQTRDGQTLKNLIDMACYLKSCETEHFQHHVSRQHNHFSEWVGKVVTDRDLANQMGLVLEKTPMSIIAIKRINLLVRHATRTPRGREKARMILENAQLPEEFLVTIDGRTIRNLWELKHFLETAPDHTISYHFHGNKNDFHEWVRHILLDLELADLLIGASDRGELLTHVDNRLSYLDGFKTYQNDDSDLTSIVEKIHEGPCVYYT